MRLASAAVAGPVWAKAVDKTHTWDAEYDVVVLGLCMAAVNARVDDDKLTLWMGCPGKRLITDTEGRVIGAVVEKDGQELRIKANGDVCLCTGGFKATPT